MPIPGQASKLDTRNRKPTNKMENLKLVQDLYSAFAQKDEAWLRKILADDVLWIQCPGFPGGDTRRGVDEVLQKVFASLHSTWSEFRVSIEEYLDAGSSIVVLGSYVGTHTETGKSMEAAFAHVYDIENGRIRRYRQYTDTVPMVEAMQP